MLDDLVARVAQTVQKEGAHVVAVVGVDEPQRVQRTPLAVRTAPRGGAPRAWQVRPHQSLALLQLTPVDDAQASCGTVRGGEGGGVRSCTSHLEGRWACGGRGGGRQFLRSESAGPGAWGPYPLPELGPVGCAAEPVQVLAQEGVHGGAGVHVGIGENGSGVGHTV